MPTSSWGRTSRPGRAKWPCTRCWPGGKRVSRNRLGVQSEFPEAVAEEAGTASDASSRNVASQCLARCIERLPAEHRKLLQLRYSDGLAIEAIARQVERTGEAVYRALSRIRRALHDCVTHACLWEGRS